MPRQKSEGEVMQGETECLDRSDRVLPGEPLREQKVASVSIVLLQDLILKFQNADAYNNLAWLYYTRRENLGEGERLALKTIELNPTKEPIYRDTLEKIKELRKLQE